MKNRRSLIAGNWKMYKTCSEAELTVGELAKRVDHVADIDIMIAPPFTALYSVSGLIKNSPIALGAQNLFWDNEGAFTGEISPKMLKSAGCDYVIIGHSERRQYFHETDQDVNKKICAAVANELIPILCIGESEQERESGETFSILNKQLEKGLEGFSINDVKTLVIAYEPIWAIGTGKTATSEQAQEVHHHIRSTLSGYFGKTLVDSMRILYGGSVKPVNIRELMSMPDIDGALVGGASLDPETFSQIVLY